jgi:hypothetical protein
MTWPITDIANQGFGRGRRLHSDKAISFHSDKMAAFVLPKLGCEAELFTDNIDQIDDAAEWAAVSDLLAAAAKYPGWRAGC